MDSKLKIGVVGASGWMAGALMAGVEYINGNYESGEKSPYSSVRGLCSRNKSALKDRKVELGLSDAKVFTDYNEMLRSPDIDAVIVSVPNHLHVDYSVKAIESGKHLFLEKPFSTTKEDSEKLKQVLKNSPLTTKLDYILIHYDEQNKLRTLIKDNAFGELSSVHFTYRHPIAINNSVEQKWKLSKEKSGGAAAMGICHAISACVYQVNAKPSFVYAVGSKSKIRNFDYETQMDLVISFDNGVVGMIQGNIDFAEKYDARHSIIGTEGQFDYNPFNKISERVMWSSKKLNREYTADAHFCKDHLDSGDVWKHKCTATIQSFVQYALKGEKDPILGLDSRLVQDVESIIWAAEESMKTGMKIKV